MREMEIMIIACNQADRVSIRRERDSAWTDS